MTKAGYFLGGWYKDDTLINQWNFTADTVTDNIILYAKWLVNFTVTFETNGGSPQPEPLSVAGGYKISEPPVMTKTDCNFGGWYKEADCINQWNFTNDLVTDNTTLYAKWNPPFFVSGANFYTKMRWLDTNVQSGGVYIIELDSDESTDKMTLFYSGKNNISITLKGIGSSRILSLNGSGSMFTIESGVTLILEDNLELHGNYGNSSSLIRVNSGANLILNSGTRITGNTYYSYSAYGAALCTSLGGGVCVAGGTFTMSGGEISGNSCSASTFFSDSSSSSYSLGGGVYVAEGTFTMSGGEITDNTCTTSSQSNASFSSSSYGGGVYIAGGTFIMSGGKIADNTARNSNYSSCYRSYGGGVCVAGGTFIMSGGEITSNTVSSFNTFGGGVYVAGGTFTISGGEITDNIASSYNSSSCGGGVYMAEGNFTMDGGEITKNTASSDVTPGTSLTSYGGGVYVAGGTFTMNNGKISGNTFLYSNVAHGGGVYVAGGTFTMGGGEISGHTITSYGGGVYVNGSIFNKTGGTIFGYSSEDNNSNTIKNSSGYILQNYGHAIHVNRNNINFRMGKDTTSGPGDNLSFDGTITPPSYSGEWDY
jgi:uncharacterized repeat protein (TIGR02543 family)